MEEARPGMTLAAPVSHPERPNQDLLRAGFLLDDTIIARMRSIGIEFIYVDFPALESLDKHLAVYLSPARQNILKQIRGAIGGLQKQTRPAISYKDYCETTRELISTLMTQGQNPVYLDQMSRQGDDAVAHAAAVAHLSLLLGLKLEQYLVEQRSRLPANRAKDIVNLGVAGMLHDLGISRLPEHLQDCSDCEPPDDEQQLQEWQSHVQIGYDLIRNEVEATAAAAVFQHHQHFDGSGFPSLRSDGTRRPMEGERIHVYARIILCANLYDRLTNPIRHPRRRNNLEVHHLLRTQYSAWCDPQVMRMLQIIAPPFPPGTRWRLSDGTFAVVTDVNANAPLKPMIQRLEQDNWTPTGELIDLRQDGAPQIEYDRQLQLVD